MDTNKHYISFPSVYMHTSPSVTSKVSDELLYGTRLEITKQYKDFARCTTEYGYSGYVQKRLLSPINDMPKAIPYIVKSTFADLFSESTCKYRPVTTLPKGSIIYSEGRTGSDGRLLEVFHRGNRCYIPQKSVCPYEKTDTISLSEIPVMRKKICDDALMYLGSPYRWGGKNPQGIDCSGLCFMSYFLNGITIWRDAYADSRFVHEIPPSKALQGDIIYFRGHAAIYIGDGEYVHSSASAGCVTVNSLHKGSIIYRGDLADKFICFARSNLL